MADGVRRISISGSSLGRVSGSSPSGPSSRGQAISGGSTNIDEALRFPLEEIPLEEREKQLHTAVEERLYYESLVSAFLLCLQEGVDIVPRPPLKEKGASYIIEASFHPPDSNKQQHRPRLSLALRGVQKPLLASGTLITEAEDKKRCYEYVSQTMLYSTDQDIERLLVVLAHEYGHYKSYRLGYHTPELAAALRLFHARRKSQQDTTQTWLVFREESTAWDFGKRFLQRIGFRQDPQHRLWKTFDIVKDDSLRTYCDALGLDNASKEVMYALSFLKAYRDLYKPKEMAAGDE